MTKFLALLRLQLLTRFADLKPKNLKNALKEKRGRTVSMAVAFIGLIAAMATLISLNRKYELVIARAAGISAWQFLTPIAFGSFLFGGNALCTGGSGLY